MCSLNALRVTRRVQLRSGGSLHKVGRSDSGVGTGTSPRKSRSFRSISAPHRLFFPVTRGGERSCAVIIGVAIASKPPSPKKSREALLCHAVLHWTFYAIKTLSLRTAGREGIRAWQERQRLRGVGTAACLFGSQWGSLQWSVSASVRCVCARRLFLCSGGVDLHPHGSETETSLHEYSNLLECDFGTADGLKKRLLKWENQIVDLQKATGEVFSDRLKCAIVLSSSPGSIRTYFRVQNRGDCAAIRLALMNYLKAEVVDSNGPVPMEVGAMKGSDKKGDKGNKGYGEGKYGKSYGKFGAKGEHGKSNEYGKGYEKVKDKGQKGKGKGLGKEGRLAPNSSFAGHCRSCGKWGRTEHVDHNDGSEDDSCLSRGC